MIKGHVDRADVNRIAGWALDTESDTPIKIELYLNDELVEEQEATHLRKDLINPDNNRHGNYGYIIQRPDLFTKEDAILRVMATSANGEQTELKGSPIVIANSHEKILVVGLPKSGTSILGTRISGSIENAEMHFEPGGNKGLCDVDLHCGLAGKLTNVVTKSLFLWYPEIELKRITKLYSKVIFIIRDPRDNLISSFFYRWYAGHKIDRQQFEGCYQRMKAKELDPAAHSFVDVMGESLHSDTFFKRTYTRYLNEIKALDKKDYLLVKYEDFVSGDYQNIEAYLGFFINQEVGVKKSMSRVVRSKGFGNWKQYFTPEDVAYFRPLVDPILDEMGYEKDWELDDPQVLNPDLGSKYMHKLFTTKL